jgi:ABC-type multidrug transport system fused ATPase/permease subunit
VAIRSREGIVVIGNRASSVESASRVYVSDEESVIEENSYRKFYHREGDLLRDGRDAEFLVVSL